MPAREPAPRVLVVEDEEPIRRLLSTTLEAEGYAVYEAATAREGETLAGNRPIDVFLIDLGLPDRDGVALIRQLRGWTQRPIIVLSARSQERQKVEALDAGADDYLTKPFGVAELHARMRVALRHAAQTTLAGDSTLRAGDVRIDLGARLVTRDGEVVHPHCHPVAPARSALATCGARRDLAAIAARGVGAGPRRAGPLPAHLHPATAPQARGRAGAAGVPADGPGVGYRLLVDRSVPRPRQDLAWCFPADAISLRRVYRLVDTVRPCIRRRCCSKRVARHRTPTRRSSTMSARPESLVWQQGRSAIPAPRKSGSSSRPRSGRSSSGTTSTSTRRSRRSSRPCSSPRAMKPRRCCRPSPPMRPASWCARSAPWSSVASAISSAASTPSSSPSW